MITIKTDINTIKNNVLINNTTSNFLSGNAITDPVAMLPITPSEEETDPDFIQKQLPENKF